MPNAFGNPYKIRATWKVYYTASKINLKIIEVKVKNFHTSRVHIINLLINITYNLGSKRINYEIVTWWPTVYLLLLLLRLLCKSNAYPIVVNKMSIKYWNCASVCPRRTTFKWEDIPIKVKSLKSNLTGQTKVMHWMNRHSFLSKNKHYNNKRLPNS